MEKSSEADIGAPNNDTQENAADAEEEGVVRPNTDDVESSIVRKQGDGASSVPLWLITFTDVMALMLTFFVLLYAMSTPQEEKWEDISDALTYKSGAFDAAAFNAGSQDVISLDKIDKTRALELDYVQTLIAGLLKQRQIDDVLLVQNGKRLVISLPSELLFESGKADVGVEGKKVIFELGGVLSRVKNRIEVIGHTDPSPVGATGGTYTTNWQLSLARAASVSRVLRDVGYEREMTVRGVSSARYDELPDAVPEKERYALSRRVDVIVMDDDGYRQNAFDVQ
tara:strand:- start:24871 stop:25719 length:849 start_codon:yes stop_codon:yes gene_type:complete